MMDKPNHTPEAIDLIVENPKEYFHSQAKVLMKFYKTELSEGDDWQHYLLRYFQTMKAIFASLERPWDKYTPIIHKGGIMASCSTEGKEARKKTISASTELINCTLFFLKQARFIDDSALFFNQQIKELELLMEATPNTEESRD